jgi:hypothetical protein
MRVKSRSIYTVLNGGCYPDRLRRKKARSRRGMPMLAFQVIGWVLILLFFGAMIGSHQRVPDR